MGHTLQTFAVEYFNNVLKTSDKTQKDITATIDTSEQTISNYLRGVSKFSLDMFERFAEALEIDIFQIIDSYHKNVILKKENPFWVPGVSVAEPFTPYGNSNKLLKEKDNVIASLKDQISTYKKMESYFDKRWNEYQKDIDKFKDEREKLISIIFDLGGQERLKDVI